MKKLVLLFLMVFIAQTAMAESPQSQNQKNERMSPVLLVIDVQHEHLQFMSEKEKPIAFRMINGCIWLFRQKGLPIIRIYHTHPQWGPKIDSEAFEFPSSIMVTDDDLKIVKNFPSAFKKTKLDSILKEKGYNTISAN